MTDAIVREKLLDLFGTLLRKIRRRVEAARGGKRAKAPDFVVCNFAMGTRGSGVFERDFWKDLCSREGVARLDLVDPLVVLKESWSPVLESEGYGHFFVRGHALFAFVLAHELTRYGMIPVHRTAGRTEEAKRRLPVGDWTLPLAALAVLAAAALLLARRRRPGSHPPGSHP